MALRSERQSAAAPIRSDPISRAAGPTLRGWAHALDLAGGRAGAADRRPRGRGADGRTAGSRGPARRFRPDGLVGRHRVRRPLRSRHPLAPAEDGADARGRRPVRRAAGSARRGGRCERRRRRRIRHRQGARAGHRAPVDRSPLRAVRRPAEPAGIRGDPDGQADPGRPVHHGQLPGRTDRPATARLPGRDGAGHDPGHRRLRDGGCLRRRTRLVAVPGRRRGVGGAHAGGRGDGPPPASAGPDRRPVRRRACSGRTRRAARGRRRWPGRPADPGPGWGHWCRRRRGCPGC